MFNCVILLTLPLLGILIQPEVKVALVYNILSVPIPRICCGDVVEVYDKYLCTASLKELTAPTIIKSKSKGKEVERERFDYNLSDCEIIIYDEEDK